MKIVLPKRHKPKNVLTFDWSADLGYAVGLLATDGCLSSNGRTVIFTSQDLELIRYVKLILKVETKVGITKNPWSETYRIQIGSVQLYDWLLSIGLTPRKSLTIAKLSVPDIYFTDFLRGHLDGDGSILTYTDFHNTSKNLNVHGAVHVTKTKDLFKNPMHIIKFAKKDSLKLLPQIYYSESLPYLSRKKVLYDDFLKNL